MFDGNRGQDPFLIASPWLYIGVGKAFPYRGSWSRCDSCAAKAHRMTCTSRRWWNRVSGGLLEDTSQDSVQPSNCVGVAACCCTAYFTKYSFPKATAGLEGSSGNPYLAATHPFPCTTMQWYSSQINISHWRYRLKNVLWHPKHPLFFPPMQFFTTEFPQLLFGPMKTISIKTPCAQEVPGEGSAGRPVFSDTASCCLLWMSPPPGITTTHKSFLSHSEDVFHFILFGEDSGICPLKKAEMVIMSWRYFFLFIELFIMRRKDPY